jgi:protein-tyrosine phosphatase
LWSDVDLHERESVSTEGGSGATLEELIERGELFEPNDDDFAQVYVGLINHLKPEFKRVIELAADAVERPLLFHCAAGKDRTGLTAALLLGLLGVDEKTILDDYELTTELFSSRRYAQLEPLVEKHGANADHVRQIVSARRPVMEVALAHIRDTSGSFDRFALDGLGVDREILNRLRLALLT